ncbi:MAG: integrase family protein [Legionella sp.]|nr:integrase family protein [Legionella sp.]
MKITKSMIDKLPVPLIKEIGKSTQKRYYDDNLKGFGVRITSGGTKAFFLEKLIKNKLSRITLGRYPELTVEMARKEAQKLLGQIAMGFDPAAEKQTAKIREITLNTVFNDYIVVRKSLKPSTLRDYKQIINKAFPSWRTKPLLSITKDKIAKQHKKLGTEHGEAYANLAMRVLRALFNFAAGQYEDSNGRTLIPENPVNRLSQTRAWYRIERRQTFIKAHELAPWYDALKQLPNLVLKDYLLLILLTGLRRQEAATLIWEQVDLTAKTLTITETKNNESHTLPLSDYLYTLFESRKKNRINAYVFPGPGAAGHIIEPRKLMAKVTEISNIQFTVHDLRRTFITIAESLDISAYALKRLLNHKMNNDVTAGYIIVDVERLRKPMQLITNYILKCMNIVESAAVIAIQPTEKEAIQ